MKIMDKDQLGVSDTVWLSPLGTARNLCVSYCVTEVIDIHVYRYEYVVMGEIMCGCCGVYPHYRTIASTVENALRLIQDKP